MWNVNGRPTTSDGKSSLCLWQGELKNKNKNLSLLWTKLVVHKFYAVSNIFKQDKSVLGPYMPPGVNRIGEVM
jgi:hypothetical protein